MAEALQIGRSKLNAHENGKTINPPVEDLLHISAYFKISVDSLLKVNLAKLGELKLRELEAGNDVYMMGSNIRVLAITVDKQNRENVEYVPIKAKAGYKAGFNDPEFIASLPKYSFPNLPRNGTYRMFPTTGDSMLPIPEDSDILAKYQQDWKSIKSGTPCVVILNGEQDFVFKKVTLQDDGHVLLESMNELYHSYIEPVTNILEIWEFERYLSNNIPEGVTDMQELKGMITKLGFEIRKMK